MSINKKKAFTLTELLVVVVIIGVLAAVVLPKFNKVIETRKTTEAEELMAAVRTEQEYRCAMDKPYIGDIANLSQIIPQASTKNFTYQLKGTGMLASSRSKSYDLKMPSYADGRVCCEGSECSKLNKDYPKCNDLIAQADYKVATECAATLPNPNPDPNPNPCTEEQVLRRACAGCGWQTREVTGCVNGHWEYSDWTGSCRSAQTETYDCATKEPGTTGTKTRTEVCDEERGVWYYPETWTGSCEAVPCEGEPVLREACGEGMCGWKTREVTECVNGEWQYTEWDNPCRTAETQTYDCATEEPGKTGTKTRTEVCNEVSGEWRYPDTWEGECKPKRWLSPLSYCATANHEDKEKGKEVPGYCRTLLFTRSCATNDGHQWGDTTGNGEKYGIYNCSANNEKVLSFLERVSQYQHVAALPPGCSFGEECDECDPSKKYYDLDNAFCETCWAHGLLNEEHTVAGRCDTMYQIPYAICREAAENPFKCYPTVNCKAVPFWQMSAGNSMVLRGNEWVPTRNDLPCLQQ